MAPGHEIRKYIKDAATKLDLGKYISLNSKVVSSIWNDSTGQWDLESEYNIYLAKAPLIRWIQADTML